MSETENRLRTLVAGHLGFCDRMELITAEAKFGADLGADSLDSVELSMAVEEEFGFEMTDDEALEGFDVEKTFGEAVKLVDSKLAALAHG